MTSRLVAEGERPILSARSAMVMVSVPSMAYSAASWAKPRPKLLQLRGETNHQVAPQSAAHGDAVRQLARVLDLVAGGGDGRAQLLVSRSSACGHTAIVGGTANTCMSACNWSVVLPRAATVRSRASVRAHHFPARARSTRAWARPRPTRRSSAAEVFRAADEALGEPLSELCFNGPAEELDKTVNAQPAILAVSIAFMRALEERLGRQLAPAFMAGHSMGQYSAMVAAGALTLEDGVRLVRERGRQMQASASDGAMAAVIGLDEARIPELLAAGQKVATSPWPTATRRDRSWSVGRARRSMRRSRRHASWARKRAIVLPVSVAAHSPLMTRAAEAMRNVLARVAVPRSARAAAWPTRTRSR